MIPDSVHDLPQLPFNFFRFVNGIGATSVFDPPQSAAVFFGTELAPARDLRDIRERETRRDKLDRTSRIFAVKIKRVSQKFAIATIRRKPLAKLGARFRAHSKRRATEEAEHAITRSIAEQGCRH